MPLLAALGWTDLLGSLGALGCVVLLYRVPAIIGSMAGSDVVSGTATVLTERAVGIATNFTTRVLKGK